MSDSSKSNSRESKYNPRDIFNIEMNSGFFSNEQKVYICLNKIKDLEQQIEILNEFIGKYTTVEADIGEIMHENGKLKNKLQVMNDSYNDLKGKYNHVCDDLEFYKALAEDPADVSLSKEVELEKTVNADIDEIKKNIKAKHKMQEQEAKQVCNENFNSWMDVDVDVDDYYFDDIRDKMKDTNSALDERVHRLEQYIKLNK